MSDNNFENNSKHSLNQSLRTTENVSLLDQSTTEIAADPVAAENFNIEKRFISVIMDKDIDSPSATNLNINAAGTQTTQTQTDTFDWLGDDKDLYELSKGFYTGPPVTLNSKTSLYDNDQPNHPQTLQFAEETAEEDDTQSEPGRSHRLLPRKLLHVLFLLLQTTLIIVVGLGLAGKDLGSFAGISVHLWSLLLMMAVFIPMLSSWLLQIVIKQMRHSKAFEGGELPNFIDSLQGPIVMLIGTIFVGSFWYRYFPRTCPPSDNPLSVCFFTLADQVFQALALIAIGFAAEMATIFYATLKFHERTFKDRIIKCRFKIYIVQQIALKALEAERQRVLGRNTSALSSAAEIRFPGQDLDDEDEDDDVYRRSYLKDFFKFIKKSYYGLLSAWRGGRRAFDTAANYVQIQVDDPAATVPVSHASSQSYAKFSRRLNKHMQLYGYDQFSRNKAGLKDYESRVLARDLFHFLCPEGRDHLRIEDLHGCFASPQAAHDAFEIFDSDTDGQISKKEFRNSIVAIYAELRDLTKSIRVAGVALGKLDVILKGVVVAFVALAILAIFSVNVTNLLTFSLSLVIGLNFVFGDLAKHFLHSIVFLFIHHPFDIGDTIVVGLFEEGVYLKDILTVKDIELMTTVFTRWNGQETYVPNHMLANAPFMTNLSRSVEQWEKIDFSVPTTTPEPKLTEMRTRIGAFLQQHSRDFFKVFDLHAIVAADMGNAETNLDELAFTLRVRCRPTSDSQKRWSRHAKLLRFIKVTLLEECISK